MGKKKKVSKQKKVESFAINTTLVVLAVIALLRFDFLNVPVLVDPSDARYAHVAEHMLLSNGWLSPMIHNGNQLESYWSKPPFGFWAMAASMSLFGNSEFAARLPAFLATLVTTLLVYVFCRKFVDKNAALDASAMYFSTPFIFIMAGSTLVDPILALFITGAIISFGLVLLDKTAKVRSWLILGYVCLVLGTLTKGPLAILICGLVIGLYLVLAREKAGLWKLRPVWGALMVLALVSPWFILMEKTHPGYLSYFFFEENLNRLVSSELKVKNGSGHRTILGFAVLALPILASPWALCMLIKDTGRNRLETFKARYTSPEFKFALAWVAAPIAFFAFGKQILAYYLLPVIPGVTCLIALWARNGDEEFAKKVDNLSRNITRFACFCLLLIFCGFVFYEHSEHIETFPRVIVQIPAFFLLALILWQSDGMGLNAFSKAAATLVIMILSLCIAVTEPLAEYNSSAALFQFISSETNGKVPKRVSFLYEAPPSSYFYSLKTLGTEQPIETVSLEHFKAEIREGLLVSRDRNFQMLPTTIQSLPSKKIGKWRIQEISESVLQRLTDDEKTNETTQTQ